MRIDFFEVIPNETNKKTHIPSYFNALLQYEEFQLVIGEEIKTPDIQKPSNDMDITEITLDI